MSNYRSDDELRSIHMSDDRQASSHRRRRKDRTRTTLLILLSLVLMLGGGTVLTGYLVSEKLGGQVDRVPAFSQLNEEARPKKPTGGTGANAINILMAGSDARSDSEDGTTGAGKGDAWQSGGQRSDTIMVLHITGDRKGAYLISLPRDSWVDIPGRSGKNKINAAYSFGGPPLYIETVEKLTGLRMDHLAVIDWTGFKALTDALGGVEMTFDKNTRFASGKYYPAGPHTLSGEEALDYVRERKHLKRGDFDRIARQQNFLRSLMRQTLSNGTITNPVKLARALDAITQNLSVDEEFTTGQMRSLALQMRDLRPGNVTFMTAPTRGTGMEGSQSVVYLDDAKCDTLWKAIRDDKVGDWLQSNGKDEVLGDQVR
ncbi:LCP family protein [Actinopolymorpha alba]|uniref:LCP family protein n=1 Tax=Actinopolymorpha alba TaxID=533267 RepID=UPI00035FCAF5|nr:LCP family protein [Actinopolymorpha alba]